MHLHVVGSAIARYREAPHWRRRVAIAAVATLFYIGNVVGIDASTRRGSFWFAIEASARWNFVEHLESAHLRCPIGDAGDAASGPAYRAGCHVQAHGAKCGFYEDATDAVDTNLACLRALKTGETGATGPKT